MITVLMSVYARESREAFNTALNSIATQTVPPAEVVLVRDGPLTQDLDDVIAKYRSLLPLREVQLEANVGLARALNRGLQTTTQPWVMRFDSDDICVPWRIERQLELIRRGDVDLFGSQIGEFDSNPDSPMRFRKVPLAHSAIARFALRRNPFNHMTVCFRKALADAVGGYPQIPLMEDYALWLMMIAAGAKTANSPDVLVHARVGNGMVGRRGGWKYLRSEWALQALMCRLGMKRPARMLIDGALRSVLFIAPVRLRSYLYGSVLRK